MIRSLLAWFVAFILVGNAAAQDQVEIDAAILREAATKPLALIQKSQQVAIENYTCSSCHHAVLAMPMFAQAHERGLPFDFAIARQFLTTSFAEYTDLDAMVQGHGFGNDVDSGWVLMTAHAVGIPPSLSTSAIAQHLASAQRADGDWRTFDARPPQSHGRITATAVSARGMSLYLPEQFQEERESRLRRARNWLLKAQPRTTEDRTYHLFGLLWTGADEGARKNAAKQVLAERRKDGGWSQLPRLESDAYATGEVLSALHQAAGLATSDPAYQRGLRFLLNTQRPDGSWQVESRLHPPARISPPYFESGFPYGRDQFISIMGTEWATMALLHAIPPQAGQEPKPTAWADITPNETEEWIRVTLNGSVADLKKALDQGMTPNAKTKQGTTALMFAARDLDKVKLLLDRGADVNARSESGYSAIMVASRYHGNTEVARLLLKHGAKVNPPEGLAVTNSGSAIFFAATNGDTDLARALMDAGARVDDQMRVFGETWVSPLLFATFRDDTAMMEYLLEKGADPNMEHADKLTPLHRAAITNQAQAARVLIANGAKVNHVDDLGMTPLLYAASIDYGDTAVVESLLAAGADRNVKDKQGRTALELARAYQHTAIANVLAGKAQARK